MVTCSSPTVLFKYNISTFEQYEPSTISMEICFDHGDENNLKTLSEDNKLKFMEECLCMLINKIIALKVEAVQNGY
jgi:hypothetical protein